MRLITQTPPYIYQCSKCRNNDFSFMWKGNQLGVYCSKCGRWLKWADKDEQNLYEMNKPDQNNVANVLDKIRAEIEALNPVDYVSMSSYEGHRGASDMKYDVLQIIDKYEEESEE